MTTTAVPAPRAPTTDWGAVGFIVASGIVAAVQVGKAAIAAPMLRSDLGLDLAAIGWLTGIFAVVSLVGGVPAGALIASFGRRRILILGLLATATGAALGAAAATLPVLFVSRVVEGAGFLLITVAAPSILGEVVHSSRRDLAFALWSCFMPVGMAMAMLAGPQFDNWRVFWWATCGLAFTLAVATPLAVPAVGRRAAKSWGNLVRDAAVTVGSAGPLALAATMMLYSLMFFALFSFLPVLLIERMQVSLYAAGLLTALATAANIVGNLAAGFLISLGTGRPLLLAGAGLAMGVAGLGIFLPGLPDVPVFLLCLIFSAIGGLVPSTLLATAPLAVPAPGLLPVVLGLVMQGSALGQFVGPVVVGNAIATHGWHAAALAVALAAVLSTAMAAALGRALKHGGRAHAPLAAFGPEAERCEPHR